MFDITTVREISYGPNEEHTVYVYRDHTETNIWYMVPVPTLRRVGAAPAFSLVKYLKNGAGLAGICNFEVELIAPPEAKAAAEKVLPPGVIWGGFTWVGGTAFFHYDIEGETEIVAVDPTLYGTNVASFSIPLETTEALNTFVNAFSNGAGASPFRVEYDMQVLTQLLGAKATVRYNAEAAITYQNTYRTERDTWGNQRQILVETKQVLQQSGAGEVTVEVGAGGTPELTQRVRDWAWTTLESQVAATVNAAAVMATGPNPVSATTSFQQSYVEDTVIDWSTPVSTFLPKFSQEEWSKLYTTVDNRRLVVTFALIGLLTNSETKLPIAERVTVTIKYPTLKTGNTFELIPGNGAQSSKTITADGDFSSGTFDPNFSYEYVIKYPNGSTYPFSSGPVSETLINISPSDFGTRQVSFIGQSVPFAPAGNVKEVQIDFFFAPPEGQTALVQTNRLTANGQDNAVAFNSFYNLPIGPSYNYKLRYLLSDNSVITSGSPIAFSDAPGNTNTGNATVIYVLDPKTLYTQFNLRTFNVAGTQPIAQASVTMQYFDTQNDGDKALFTNTWDAWMPVGKPVIETAQPPFNFQAVDNTNTAFFNMQGEIYYGDGSSVNLSQYKQPSGNKVFMIYSDSENYSVRIDTAAVDWDQVAAVNTTFFRLTPAAQEEFAEKGLPELFFKPREIMTPAEREVADRSQAEIYAFSLLAPPQGQPVDDYTRHYALRRLKSQPFIEFYYTASYVLKDMKGTRTLSRQEVVDELFVSLPAVPPEGKSQGFIRQRIDPQKLLAAQSKR
jgi:hypothetical protein